jgi:limonene-1,2-epoxide hydrolase
MTLDEARILVERQARAWEAADLDAIGADFAEDGKIVCWREYFDTAKMG